MGSGRIPRHSCFRGWCEAGRGCLGVRGFGGRVAVGLWVSNAFYGLRSWLCRFGVRVGGCVCQLPVHAFTTPPHLRPLPLRQVGARAQARARSRARSQARSTARSRAVMKSRASGGPRQPQGNLRGSLGWLGESQRLRFVGWLRFVPLGRVVSPGGTAPVSGGQVRALAVGRAGGGCQSANLTPGHRHCRRSPADATEGNEPKTGRRSTKPSGAVPATRRARPPVQRVAARQSRGARSGLAGASADAGAGSPGRQG